LRGEPAAVRAARRGTSENRLAELTGQLAEKQADVPTERDVAEAPRNIDPLWDELFPAEKERIVRLLIERIVMDTDSMTMRPRSTGIGEMVAEMNAVVARILRLSTLAPDIVEAILDGREPSGLSPRKLTGNLPPMWEEQRKLFGFGEK
jgi:hypothetical protein